jgi:putative endonuclease
MPVKKNNDKGKAGEDYTVKYLESQGYKIIARNWQDSHREIDIIAWKDDTTVFVEVKTRFGSDAGLPEQGMSKNKIKQLHLAAETYIFQNNLDKVRFDLMALMFIENEKPDILYIENAI